MIRSSCLFCLQIHEVAEWRSSNPEFFQTVLLRSSNPSKDGAERYQMKPALRHVLRGGGVWVGFFLFAISKQDWKVRPLCYTTTTTTTENPTSLQACFHFQTTRKNLFAGQSNSSIHMVRSCPGIMSELIDFHLPAVVRIKAKHYKMMPDGGVQVRSKKFCMKRQNSSFELLRILTAKAFNISGEFTVSSRNGRNEFVPLSSEWDLDVAISDSVDSCLYLMVQEQPVERALDEWDIIGPGDIPLPEGIEVNFLGRKDSFLGSIISQMEKTVYRMSRALSVESSPEGNFPMTLSEFENFLDSEGRLVRPHEFHLAVYRSGVESSIRPSVWMHLLNVFPRGITAHEREKMLALKSDEYFNLRDEWQKIMNEGEACQKLKDITNLVQKDATRTDRTQKFFSGTEGNENIRSLFNILTTYAVFHPRVCYCQGMSDLLSPILFVMKDEAHAYIAFCGLLKRMESNFLPDGRSIRKKFIHLRRLLCYYDPELFAFLKNQDATDLFFTYRWLLLDLKREFAYNETLHMLEVLWGSLPPKPPDKELFLYDETFAPKDELVSSMRTSTNTNSSSDNLIWINNHFSSSTPSGKKHSGPLSKKMAMRARRESELRKLFEKDSCVDDNEEIKLPIYYRKKKYRSYTARKLTLLSSSMTRQDTTMLTPKMSPDEKQSFCQSWAYGEDFENQPIKLNTAVLSAREFLRTQWCYSNTVNEIQLNNWLYRNWWSDSCNKLDDASSAVTSAQRKRHRSSDSNYSTNSEELLTDGEFRSTNCNKNESHVTRSRSEGYESDMAFTSASEMSCSDADDDDDEDFDDNDFYKSRLADSMAGKKAEEAPFYFERKKELLPSPHLLGDGNPFLMFMCIAMLTQHRDVILRKRMDANDLCMLFDKLIRKHDLCKTLKQARKMFSDYLNMGWRDTDLSDSEKDEVGVVT